MKQSRACQQMLTSLPGFWGQTLSQKWTLFFHATRPRRHARRPTPKGLTPLPAGRVPGTSTGMFSMLVESDVLVGSRSIFL